MIDRSSTAKQPSETIAYGDGIYAVDADYLRPGLAAIHFIVQDGHAAIIDTGTRHAVPAVLRALARLGVGPEAVDWVILTHVHLDHAGGAGVLLSHCPHARLVVHPRGARHVIDPARLVAGAVVVYGEALFQRLYGQVVPAAAQRVIEAAEGHELELRGRRLVVLDTPGHARHHLCLHDPATGSLFTGDAFGLSYRDFDVDGRAFVFPTTTPVQFEPEAMHASIERLMALDPQAAYLTHFGRVGGLSRLAEDLHDLIDAFVRLARQSPGDAHVRHGWLKTELEALLLERLRRHGCTLSEARVRELLAHDLELNAQGLEVWLDRSRSTEAGLG